MRGPGGGERRGLPAIAGTVGDQQDGCRRHGAVARAPSLSELDREEDGVAEGCALARRQRVESVAREHAVGRRRERDVRAGADADHSDAVFLRQRGQKLRGRRGGGGEPGRAHVLGQHRARHVDGEYDRRLLSWDADIGVRASGTDDERGEAEQQEPERHVAPRPGAARDQIRDQGAPREAPRLDRTLALLPEPQPHE